MTNVNSEVKVETNAVQTTKSKVQKNAKNRTPFRGWKENLAGYAFIAPMFIGTSILVLFPILSSFVLSFTNWNFVAGYENAKFVGFENFSKLLTNALFLKGLFNNVLLILAVPITLLISLALAVIINKYVYLKDLFKVIYFMPFISSIVAVAVVFQVLFHPTKGPINQLLLTLGVENPPGWIADVTFALPSVMLIMVWTGIGFNLIIYLAGLQNIPKELYEAAQMDGATAWSQFTKDYDSVSVTDNFLIVCYGCYFKL